MKSKEDNQLQIQEERTEQAEFPNDPIERVGKVLCAVNIGPKSATLLLLPQQGFIAPYPDLADRFKATMAGTSMSVVENTIAPAYTDQSLVHVGLVAKKLSIDYFGQEKTVGYGLSPEGIRYGLPAAALALFFESKHNMSLFPVFGSVSSRSTEESRAPLNRAMILWYLATTSGSILEDEICKETKLEQSVVNNALPQLRKSGVITHATFQHEGVRRVQYNISSEFDTEVAPINKEPTLTNIIADICRENATSPLTPELILDNMPEEIKTRRNSKALIINIRTILSGLANQGFLERKDGYKGGQAQSSVKITEKGILVVTEFLYPLLSLMRDEVNEATIQTLTKRIHENFVQFARTSAELYYPFSKSAKITNSEANKDTVYDLLSSDVELSVPEIARRLHDAHKSTVYRHVAHLVEEGRIEKVQKGKQFAYRKLK